MEIQAREYQHMLRGPRFAAWRPVVATMLLALFAAVMLGAVIGLGAFFGLGDAMRQLNAGEGMNAVAFLATNLGLAALIPATMLATRVVYGVRPGFVSSVAGRFRWGWMLRCCGVVVPVYLLIAGIDFFFGEEAGEIPPQRLLLLLIVLTTTPLQAAGEEYVTRGFILQNVGAWFAQARVAMVAATALSVGLFSAAHGSTDGLILLSLSITALGTCFVTWRTGGLEAAVVLHAVNNMTGFIYSLLFGGWNEGIINQTSAGDPREVLVTTAIFLVTVPLILWLARRHGIQRVYQPVVDGVPAPDVVGSLPNRGWLWGSASAAGVLVLLGFGAVAMVHTNLKGAPTPPVRHYAEIAATMGITADGCFKGFLVEALPMEIRYFDTRELVADDITIQLDDLEVAGSAGVFQFPVSAELMAANPVFRVLRPDGTRITYWYSFVNGNAKHRGECQLPEP